MSQPRVNCRRLVMLTALSLLIWPSVAGGDLHPADVSPAGVTGSRPIVASDGAGTVVALWRELGDESSAIRAAVRSPGSDWESKRISVPALSTESPALAMDRLGNAVAVWQRSSGKDSVVQAAVRPANGDWSKPDDLSTPDALAFGANVAIDAGHITAVWLSGNGGRSLVSSTRTIDGSWTAAQPVTLVGGPALPVVAVDKQGDAAVAWQTSSDGFRVIASATQPFGAKWSAPEILSGAVRNASRPRLVMDAAGDAFAGWIRSNGDWGVAQVDYRPASGSWGIPENLSNRSGSASGLELAINTDGDAIAAWRQGSPDANLWSSSRFAGATHWRARVPVTENWSGLDAKIALDEQGNATAVWSGDATVSASFKPVDKPWQDDYLLSSYDDFSLAPAVTTTATARATALWIRAGENDDRIQSVAYDIDTSAQEAEDEEDDSGDSGDFGVNTDTFFGTRHADHLVGTPGNDVFYGFGGNDVIDGRGGRDVILGGPGNDRLVGGVGADRLYGGLGRDRLLGGRGSDFLSGDIGPDRLAGGRGADVLLGGGGHDLLMGNQGRDTLRAKDGMADRVSGGRGLDQYRLDRWLDHARSIESRFH